ncbi:MAG: sulfotransferase [bacterium]|nr:sulfotransferase [bacterium]
MATRLPDVVLIGYKKAATTFLRSYFTSHPNITWTRNARHFVLDNRYLSTQYCADLPDDEATRKCYVDMFEGLSIGYIRKNETPDWSEVGYTPGVTPASASLTSSHEEIAQRIKATVPQTKILIVLRNQVSWLRSYYLHQINSLPENQRAFTDFLNTLEGRNALYSGNFDLTIEAYQQVFGKENVHVMLLEQIHTQQDETLQKLCTFLGVPFIAFSSDREKRN